MYPHSIFFGLALVILAMSSPAEGATTVLLAGSVKPIGATASSTTARIPQAYVSRAALSANEAGASVTFEVTLKMRNLAELQKRVSRGEHVSRDEIASRYAPSAADYQAVIEWLTAQGFTIVRTEPTRLAVFVRGTVSRISQAMGVSFARVSADGTEYTSAITAPRVPGSLAPALLGINGLQPHIRAHPDLAVKASSTLVSPFLPVQIATAYQAASLYAGDITGAGQTIALVDDTFVSPSDLESFWKAANVSQSISNIEFVQAVPGALHSPSTEADLDVEWTSALAPGARIRVYGSGDFASSEVDQAYEQLYEDVTNHPEYGIHQLSLSYGYGETEITSSQAQTDDQYFTEIAAAGVTIFASSGDQGATPNSPDGNQAGGPGPLQVNFPASDPNVTAVGGTNLTLAANNAITSEVAWNSNNPAAFADASGGGVSIYFNRPAWQNGNGTGNGTMREVPDVSSAADGSAGCLVIGGGTNLVVVGTSWSCPTWAAFCALFNQARENAGQPDLGILGPSIYPLLSPAATYAANFRDVVSGNNIVWYGQGYSAGPGYDLVTGLGSPKAATLAHTLAGAKTLAGVVGPPSFVEVKPGQSASFTVALKNGSATYQWQVLPLGSTTWIDVNNSAPFSGANSPTLTVTNPSAAVNGDLVRCVLSLNGATVITTPSSALAIETPLTISQPKIQYTSAAGAGSFNYPGGIAIDKSGNLYIADFNNNAIRELTPTGIITTPFGSLNGSQGAGNSDGIGNAAQFNEPNAVAYDGINTLYVADTGNNLVRTITLSTGQVSTLAGTNGEFATPNGIAVDGSGNVYVANENDQTICKAAQNGTVSVFAGQTGVPGYADGDGTTQALFNSPNSVAVDNSGNVYVADTGNSVVRKITPNGTVSTLAGRPGVAGYRDGAGSFALFNGPVGVTVDSANNIYVADCTTTAGVQGNDVIRHISPSGAVTTLAGQPGVAGSANGVGSAAQFQSPQALALNGAGMFYIADTFNQTIRLGLPATPLKVAYLSGIEQNGALLPGAAADGNVVVGASATSTLTISNIGDATLTVTGIQFPAGFSGSWSSGTIAAGSSHTITVTFSPTAHTGYGGPITVTSNADATLGSFSASGTGVNPPPAGALSVDEYQNASLVPIPNPFDCGDVFLNSGKTEPAAILLIQNPTGVALFISSITFPTGYSGTWSSQVPAGGTSNLYLYFNPTAVGTYTGTIVVNSDFFGSPLTIPVTGQGETTPTVVTGTVSIVNFSTAILHGTVTPNNNAPEAGFAYGTTAPYTTDTPEEVISGAAAVPIFAQITGLLPNTVYHYQAFANQVAGALHSFTTPVGEYLGATPVAYVSAFGAQLLSAVSAGGTNSQAYFQYGPTTGYGSQTPGQAISGTNVFNFSQQIIGLAPSTTYHFQLVVTNSSGTQYGPDQTFTSSPLATALAAQTGQAAPGVSSGTFSAFGNAAVAADDGVAFRATLTGTPAANASGIWANQGSDTLTAIAQTGLTAPGTGSATFATLTDPVYNDNQDVAFGGTLNIAAGLVSTANATGVWASSSGTLGLLARQGSTAPGAGGASFATFTATALTDSAGAIIAGTLTANSSLGVTAANNKGVWEGDTAADLTLMLRTGEMTDTGKTLASFNFLPVETYVGGQTRGFAPLTGHLAATATFTDKSNGIIMLASPGSPQAVVTSGDAADANGDFFTTFSSPALNDNDHVAFMGMTDTTFASAMPVNTGIWADTSSGTLTWVTRIGFPAPSAETFVSFSDPVYNDNEVLAFRAVVSVYSNSKVSDVTGIYATGGNLAHLALVALQNAQAPGCPPGTTFSAFTSLALNDCTGADQQGGVIFLATLAGTGVTAANNTAMYAVDGTGTLQLVVRTGDLFNGKTIATLSFLPGETLVNGQSRSFSSASGDLVYNATFTDKTQAIFNVGFPPAPPSQ
jgi:kumamolisin